MFSACMKKELLGTFGRNLTVFKPKLTRSRRNMNGDVSKIKFICYREGDIYILHV
jgi:hypothetical protein